MQLFHSPSETVGVHYSGHLAFARGELQSVDDVGNARQRSAMRGRRIIFMMRSPTPLLLPQFVFAEGENDVGYVVHRCIVDEICEILRPLSPQRKTRSEVLEEVDHFRRWLLPLSRSLGGFSLNAVHGGVRALARHTLRSLGGGA